MCPLPPWSSRSSNRRDSHTESEPTDKLRRRCRSDRPPPSTAPKVSIGFPLTASEIQRGAHFTLSWTYAGITSPQWKIYINYGDGILVDRTQSRQCTPDSCSQSMSRQSGRYELIIKELTTSIDDKVAFTVQ